MFSELIHPFLKLLNFVLKQQSHILHLPLRGTGIGFVGVLQLAVFVTSSNSGRDVESVITAIWHFSLWSKTLHCWQKLSKSTNQRVYQDLVYRNALLLKILTSVPAPLSPVPLFFSSLSFLRTALHYLNAWNRLQLPLIFYLPENTTLHREFKRSRLFWNYCIQRSPQDSKPSADSNTRLSLAKSMTGCIKFTKRVGLWIDFWQLDNIF